MTTSEPTRQQLLEAEQIITKLVTRLQVELDNCDFPLGLGDDLRAMAAIKCTVVQRLAVQVIGPYGVLSQYAFLQLVSDGFVAELDKLYREAK